MSELDDIFGGDDESGLDLFGTDNSIGNSDVGGFDLGSIDDFSDGTTTPVTGTDLTGGYLGGLTNLGQQLLGGYNQLAGSVTNGINTPLSGYDQGLVDDYGSLGYQSPTQVAPTSPLTSNTLLLGGVALVVLLLVLK